MHSKEYTQLPLHEDGLPAAAPKRIGGWKVGIPLGILFLLVTAMGTGFAGCKDKMNGLGLMGAHDKGMHGSHSASLAASACPVQPAPRSVGIDWNPAADEDYARMAAARLSAAVQIQTVSYDDLPQDPENERFDGHYEFARWMGSTFPTVYASLEHEMVNTHGHLFTWRGTKQGGKPIMLMAHEDTVPVNPDTVDQWTYPPWSGAVTDDATPNTPGTWIWGRGSSDCKNSLVGILGAIERLIEEDYVPERDVLIAYGFDEEVSQINKRNTADLSDWRRSWCQAHCCCH